MSKIDIIDIVDIKQDMENVYLSNNYLTKQDIYNLTNYLRDKLLPNEVDELDPFVFCKKHSEYIGLELRDFDSAKMGGFIYKNPGNKKSWILLNTSLSYESQYFNLAHELGHYFIHPSDREYKCNIDLEEFDPYEYQANQFAAEFLCPLDTIFDTIKEFEITFNKKSHLVKLQHEIKNKTYLSDTALQYRISNNKYEILQFLKGCPRNEIEIISLANQRKRNICCLYPYEQ